MQLHYTCHSKTMEIRVQSPDIVAVANAGYGGERHHCILKWKIKYEERVAEILMQALFN